MKNLRKLLALALAVLMLMTVLSGCRFNLFGGEETEETTPSADPSDTQPGETDSTKTQYSI